MAKKVLSVMLVLAMLITGLTFSASAATTQKVDGVTYTVVTTEEELFDALQAGKKVMLGNDIDLSTKFKSGVRVPAGTELNGNGYSLTYKGVLNANLFTFSQGTRVANGTVTIKNVNFGKKDAPIALVGTRSLFASGAAFGCITDFSNVNFYIDKTATMNGNSAAIFTALDLVANFKGCMLDVRLANASGGTLHGGWFCSVDGFVTMTNCVTTGSIEGKFGAAAFAAQVTTGELVLENCVNLAGVSASGYVGGFVANIGGGAETVYITDCINYGTVISTAANYDSMAGGFIGRLSNKADPDNRRLHVLIDCENYGTIQSGSSAGGFVGRSHDYDHYNNIYLTFTGCHNYGNVSGGAYAGGIIGVASPLIYKVDMFDCVNVGKVYSANGYAGNFGGLLSTAKVKGGIAAGMLVATTDKMGSLGGQTSGSYIVGAGDLAGQTKTVRSSNCEGVTYYGTANNPHTTGVTKVSDVNTLISKLSELCQKQFIAADSGSKNAYVVVATPALRGIQLDTTGKNVNMRFIGVLDATASYGGYGFEITITTSKGTVTQKIESSKIVDKIEKNVNNKTGYIAATAYSVEGFFTADAINLPANERVIIKATPFALSKDGNTTYTGATKLITLNDGMVVNEHLMLNGVMLEDFAIIWAGTNKQAEKTLATRLSNKLAELTGIVIPVFADYGNHSRKAEIVVGKTEKKGSDKAPAGRVVAPLGTNGSISITGDNTAQLGEAVTWCIEYIESMVKQGENILEVTEAVTAPADTTVSVMAFNMGAQDNTNIKKAEWDLIVDYLPDILTSQEPWAGFLDDFLNDYAVRPDTKFQASTSDDDVMVTNVNNKAFTGNDYYGVYWGAPRWKPDDPNNPADGYSKHAGKASYSVILYAKDRFTVDEENSGTFWLSDRPDVSNSMFVGSNFARCATYATLIDNNTGEKFVVVNVHLDFDTKIQVPSVTVLLTELKARVGSDLPIIITGDMNSAATSDTIKHYKSNTIMSMTSLDDLCDRAYRDERNIDWLFTNKPSRMEVLTFKYCGEKNLLNNIWNDSMIVGWPSDHPAMYAEFKFIS